MIIRRFDEIEAAPVSQLKYRGEAVKVEGVTIRWLAHAQVGDENYLHNFAVRYFTLEPGAVIPVHAHQYVEAVVILQGEAAVESGGHKEIIKTLDTLYVPSNEEHSLTNAGSGPVHLICCIDCHGEDKGNCIPA